MEKRKGSQSAGLEEDDDRARKRRKQSETPSTFQQNRSPKVLSDARALFELVWNHQERNRNIRLDFEVLPDRTAIPDYYQKIANPISLHEIQSKLDDGQYTDINALKADLLLMCENATTYNKVKSRIHGDALRLRNVVEAFGTDEPLANSRSKREASASTQPTPVRGSQRPSRGGPAALHSAQLKIIDDMMNYKDANGYLVAQPFLTLPNKKTYADYYRVIKQPISLNSLKKNVKEGKYPHWHDFEQACLLLRRNAEEYNDEASEIVKDARKLVDYGLSRLQQERAKLGDTGSSGSGIKLRLNVGGQRAPSPKASTSGPAPKIKLNFGGRQTPTQTQRPKSVSTPVIPAAHVSPPIQATVSTPTPMVNGGMNKIMIDLQDNRSEPEAYVSNHNNSLPEAASQTQNASIAPVAPLAPLAPTAVATTVDPTHLQAAMTGSPAPQIYAAAVNGHTPPVESTRSQTPQSQPPHVSPAPSANPMPPPQRLSATPSSTPRPPSYSPVPSVNMPQSQPMHTVSYARPSNMVLEEPFYRAEGKDATSALLTSLRISSTSSLKPEFQYSNVLKPDNKKVQVNYCLSLPSECQKVAVTPVLSQSLHGRPYQLKMDCRIGSSSIKQLQPSSQKKNGDPVYEILLGEGLVNIIECTVVAPSSTGSRAASGARVPGWELERFKLYITLSE